MKLSPKLDKKTYLRLKKRLKIRKTVSGTSKKPRLCVYKSLKYIYAQLVDDEKRKVICEYSSLKEKKQANQKVAKAVGEKLAEKAKTKKISEVVFDRSGYLYHGRVKALADGAREKGLRF